MTVGNYTLTNHVAAFAITGDITVCVKVAPADWTPATQMCLVAKYVTTTNQRAWELRLEANGSLVWTHSIDGTSAGNRSAQTQLVGGVHPLAALAGFAVRWLMVTIDVDNGAAGWTARFYHSSDNVETAGAVTTWTLLDTRTAAGVTSIFNATSAGISLAAIDGGTARTYTGRTFACSVRNGIGAGGTFGGTEVYAVRGDDVPADNGAATQTFTSASGHTVTVFRSGTPDTLLVPSVAAGGGSESLVFGGFFPIGADLQPADTASITKWVIDRGINLFVRSSPLNGDPTAWSAQITAWNTANPANPLKQLRHPRPTPANDVGLASLFAWSQPDEPDLTSNQDTYTFESLQAQYATWKAANPTLPVFLNVTGEMIQHDIRYYPGNMPDGQTAHSEPWMKKYFAAADILCADMYPANRALMGTAHTLIGDMMTKLLTWQEPERAKPIITYIECADYSTAADRPAPGPTAAEMRGQIWFMITRGTRGILYFPERVAPSFQSDVTPVANANEMPIQHARIQSIAAVLQGPIDPAGTTVTVSHPMYACWRHTALNKYLIVVNFSSSARTSQAIPTTGLGAATTAEVVDEGRNVTITAGTITDNFPAYEAHVYKVAV